MKLYVVRHGIASEATSPGVEADSQRPLTTEGRDKINKIARAMKKLGIKPDVILSSPYIRAKETAEIVADELDRKKALKFSKLLIPTGKAEAIITEIVENHMVDELVIVGHEPCLSLLISALVVGNPDLAITLKKGGVCCLSASDLRAERRASVEWLITPKIALKV